MKELIKGLGTILLFMMAVVLSLALGLALTYLLIKYLAWALWVAISFGVFVALLMVAFSKDKSHKT